MERQTTLLDKEAIPCKYYAEEDEIQIEYNKYIECCRKSIW
jgi:hypothetical protein